MRLEGLAERHGPVAPEPLYAIDARHTLDLDPLFARLADLGDAAHGAALFHATLVAALAEWVAGASRETGIRTVAGAGGCFLNAILARGLQAALAARGLELLEAGQAPPNDGGIALGQAWVALRTLEG
jgi:hydrogenase maturation protein HypF